MDILNELKIGNIDNINEESLRQYLSSLLRMIDEAKV